MAEKEMTGELVPLRWYVRKGFPPRLQWMERTMPPQWHDVPFEFDDAPPFRAMIDQALKGKEG